MITNFLIKVIHRASGYYILTNARHINHTGRRRSEPSRIFVECRGIQAIRAFMDNIGTRSNSEELKQRLLDGKINISGLDWTMDWDFVVVDTTIDDDRLALDKKADMLFDIQQSDKAYLCLSIKMEKSKS